MNLSISELISRSLSPDPRLSPEKPGGGGGRIGRAKRVVEVEKYSREIFPFLRSTSNARGEYRNGDGMGVLISLGPVLCD